MMWKTSYRKTRACLSIVLLCGLLSCVGGTAWADPIGPGFDLLSTPEFLLPLGPPGGPVARMAGDPIGPGNTDTIVERLAPGPPEGSSATIPIELVALSLSSVEPVVIDLGMGAQPYDLHIGLGSAPSMGTMTINHPPGPGGTFDSFFDVFTELTFTPEGGGPPVVMPRQDPLSSMNSPWSHMRPPNYPQDPLYPSGGFYTGPIDHTGPHPHTDPSMPEPTSLLLLVVGALGFGLTGFSRSAREA